MTLWLLWYASLALSAVSVAIMLLLVLRRLLQMSGDRKRVRLRKATSAALMAYIDGAADVEAVRRASAGRIDIVDDLVVEMRELLRGEDAQRLAAAAREIGGVAQEARRLRRRNPATRADAARRLAMFGSDAVPYLEAALRDPSPTVRTAAAVALADLDAAPRLGTLAEVMGIGTEAHSEDLRRIFRRAVAVDIGDAVRLLEDEWTSDAVRVLLLDGLGHAGALQAVGVVGAMVQHGSSEVRAEALRSLAHLGHPAAASVVIEALHDPDWRVRAQAANCVRRVGIDGAVGRLEELLLDEEWWVRFRSAEALRSLGAAGRDVLVRASARTDKSGRVAQLVLAEGKES